jgi:DNA-binding CsgD family transcriptional regulator
MGTLEIEELAAGVTSFERSRQSLVGRRAECERLDELALATAAGQGSSLVVRGDAGSGKSALLEYLVDNAAGCRVIRVTGVESEAGYPFAGLQRLCSPLSDRLDSLPGPQRSALATAFGLERGEAPDRFLVGVGAHTLLTLVAAERPLICVVDDAQWLDPVSLETLAFVARRTSPGSFALVAAIPGAADHNELNGLPELTVGGLEDEHARALLDATVVGPLDEQVRDRIVIETRGNPRALLDLLRGVTPDELAGGFGALARHATAVPDDLVELPEATRQLVVLAAAEPWGSAVLLWRAAAELGIGPEAAEPATAAGILEFGGRVTFRDPSARAAAYRSATREARCEAHQALAAALDPVVDADWRAWHRSQASVALDEDVAAELEQAVDRARARGGMPAAAALLERAAELTPSPERRAKRSLAAARSKLVAGAPESARRLAALSEPGPLDGQILCAELELIVAGGGAKVSSQLLDAARRLVTVDEPSAREVYLEAFAAALDGGANEVAQAVAAAGLRGVPPAPRGCDLLLAGLTALFLDGSAAGAPVLAQALRAVRDEIASGDDVLRWLLVASRVARGLGDDEAWEELTAHHVRAARAAGALGFLPGAINERMAFEHFAGNTTAIQQLAAELDATVASTGSRVSSHAPLLLAARSGSALELSSLLQSPPPGAAWPVAAEAARAELLNGIGGWNDALTSAEWVGEQSGKLGSNLWVALEHVEAAVRLGEPGRATTAVARIGELSAAAESDWSLGTSSLCRALLASDAEAEELYSDAIDRLGRTRMRVVHARAELLYGEWLRRQGRRLDARAHLRLAHEALLDAGAEGFSERARRELLATGETARKRVDETRGDLTPQEAEIAGLAAAGHTNTQIGTKLFLSPRTIEWHLRKIYPKLGIASRRELPSALPNARFTAVAA